MPHDPDVPCAGCGKLLWSSQTSLGAGERTCRDCRRREPRPYGRRVPELPLRSCAWESCGRIFQPQPKARNRPPQQFCSKSCAAAARNHAGITRPLVSAQHTRTRALAKARKRRLLLDAAPWDGIPDQAILDRDQYLCQMSACRYKTRMISREERYPAGGSPSVDHIVPLSRGGDDTQFNKRAAHLSCNQARGNRLEV